MFLSKCINSIAKCSNSIYNAKYKSLLLLPSSNATCKRHISLTHLYNFPKCELTADRYPVERRNYAKVTSRDVDYFVNILEKNRVVLGEEELEGHNTDWMSIVRGSSNVMLKPKTTEEISKILAYCNERCLAVCPQGGNTGLVGGSVPVFDEIILSTSLMNKIVNLDELGGIVTCEAGCVLEAVNEHLERYNLMMPLDLGAKGSCQLGGNISTNAGGLRLLRYGNLHGNVLGVEVVLPNGQVVDCLSSLKKDNTGYDLKHLFIGSEGTLGVVTKVSVQCPPRPKAINVSFLGLSSFEDMLWTYREAKSKLAEILSSCELIDDLSLQCLIQNLHMHPPISQFPFYMLVETSGSNSQHDEEKLNLFLESCMSSGRVQDGTVATEPSKIKAIWALRERIAESMLKDGYAYKYDLSIPLPAFYSIVEDMQERLKGKVLRCTGYGHLGDGNLHFNVTTKEFDKSVLDLIEPYIFELVSRYKGSISAEHGLGFKKKDFISYSKSQSAISIMHKLKALFDPNAILNPYKVLPDV